MRIGYTFQSVISSKVYQEVNAKSCIYFLTQKHLEPLRILIFSI